MSDGTNTEVQTRGDPVCYTNPRPTRTTETWTGASGLAAAATFAVQAAVTFPSNATNSFFVTAVCGEQQVQVIVNANGVLTPAHSSSAARPRRLGVAKLDQFSRSIHDFSTLMAKATSEHWTLVGLHVVDTSTPSGEAMANTLATFS
jgi:hypothetical protein